MMGIWYWRMNSSNIAGETSVVSWLAMKTQSCSRRTGRPSAAGSGSSRAYGMAWFSWSHRRQSPADSACSWVRRTPSRMNAHSRCSHSGRSTMSHIICSSPRSWARSVEMSPAQTV